MTDYEIISEKLKEKIQNKGYELKSGRISFPKNIRNEFRKEIGDYNSDERRIITKMIDIYNDL